MGFRIEAFGDTDVGRRRSHNEDSFAVESSSRLLVVADGMGGHAAGEVASQITVESIREFFGESGEDAAKGGESGRTQGERLVTAQMLGGDFSATGTPSGGSPV